MPTSGPQMSSACETPTVGSSERVMASGITMNADEKKHMMTPTVRSALDRSVRAPSRSLVAMAWEICGNNAVATEVAMSE